MIDLSQLRGDNDVAAGFHVTNGLYAFDVQSEGTGGATPGETIKGHMPVLDIHFMMANGKTTHRISVAPDSIMALISVMSAWRLGLDQPQTHTQGDTQ